MSAALAHTGRSGVSRFTFHVSRAAALLAALWAGSLWTICGIVAPSLFALLDDRRLAGDLAGSFFRIEAWFGLFCGGLLALLLSVARTGRRGTYVWIAITALAPVLSEVGIRPLMSAARAAGDMARFGLLHTVSAVLFVLASAGALILILRLTRPAE